MNEMNEKDLEKVSGGDNLQRFPYLIEDGARVRHKFLDYEGILVRHDHFEEENFNYVCIVRMDDGGEREADECDLERV